MTDLDTTMDLLTRMGVVFECEPEIPYGTAKPTGRLFITVRQGEGPKNTGYADFLTRLIFDESGDLVEWGAWE